MAPIELRAIVQSLAQAGVLVRTTDSLPDHITHVADDSRLVEPGGMFCAVRGTSQDGHEFVEEARRNGAAVIVVTHPIGTGGEIVVSDDRAATAIAAAEFHGKPASKLRMIGVTGTNGKSTVTALTAHLLNTGGDVGMLGTIGAFAPNGRAVYREGLTTPGVVGLMSTLAELVKEGCHRVVMEVSSHALDQRRVMGLEFEASVFTNLTHDHLDYHASVDDYFRAKARLVDYTRPDGSLIVNAEDPAWDDLPRLPRGLTISFGIECDADVRAIDVGISGDGIEFTLAAHASVGGQGRSHSQRVRLPLLGRFNASNALAAAAGALAVGAPWDAVVDRLHAAPQIPGRMERIHAGRFLVLRDYAHTPDALQRAIEVARTLTERRLVVVFGCGGDRDRHKRAPMGRIAANGADLAVVTSDNPRTEDPDLIIDDVEEGMRGHAYIRSVDRREAIHRALDQLNEGDCLLLAGKGHETYQVIGTERRPFDERDIVLSALGQVV